jgi:hypothetical protein
MYVKKVSGIFVRIILLIPLVDTIAETLVDTIAETLVDTIAETLVDTIAETH